MSGKEKNIILCGFMGCGKTTVGRLLARETGRKFIDMDSFIEERAGKTVAQIFAQEGEPRFRALEHEAAQALARETGLVVAAGGGALVCRENAECLGRTGVIVLLDAPLEELKKRLKNDASRPLLQKPDRDAVIEALHRERMPLYRQAAHLTVPAGGPPLAVAHEVLRQVKSGG